jgi:hypothetical protein
LTELGTSVVRYDSHATDFANDYLGIKNGEEVKDDIAVNHHRNPSCSLCWDEGHRAMGFKCRVVAAYKTYQIKWSDIPEMAKRLGNPLYYDVVQPGEEASRRIHEWRSTSTAIPAGARHLVLLMPTTG